MMNPNKVGFVFGLVISGWHVLWAALVALEFAQRLLNFVFWAHMIQPIYMVNAFDPKAAATLIVITFITGYAFGFFGAVIWNKLHQPK